MRPFFLALPAALGAAISGAYVLAPQREQLAPHQVPGVQRFITVGGHTLHYSDEGPREGTTVVLIHGFGSWVFSWRNERAALAQAGLRVLAFDMLGSGASDRPAEPIYTTELQARLLIDALGQLGIHSAQLVGHSYGGRVAAQIALYAPALVSSLVLLAAEAISSERPPVAELLKLPGIGFALAFYSTAPQLVGNGLRLVSKRHDWITQAVIDGYAAPLAVRGAAASQVWQGRSPKDGALPVPQHIASITVPTLLIWGGNDPVFPAEHGTQLARTMPQATLETLPGVGHIPHEEAGAEVSALLLRWLRQQGD